MPILNNTVLYTLNLCISFDLMFSVLTPVKLKKKINQKDFFLIKKRNPFTFRKTLFIQSLNINES